MTLEGVRMTIAFLLGIIVGYAACHYQPRLIAAVKARWAKAMAQPPGAN